jgi:hypothetical protein
LKLPCALCRLPAAAFGELGLARVVVIRHEVEPPDFTAFTMNRFLDDLAKRGHEILITRGATGLPDGDAAILHVNLSVVPEDYAAAAARYPIALNGKALDIRKRNVSRNIVAKDSDWTGPVIVKTDLNCGGLPEYLLDEQAKEMGKPPLGARRPIDYKLVPRFADVSERIWSRPWLIVERFLPEWDENGFYTRSWIFVGDAGRCVRCRSAKPIVKGHGIIDVTHVDVPEFIKEERLRLGLDFGKMDFVVHNGEPVLLDANKTVGQPPDTREGVDITAFIDALERMLTRESMPA